MSRRSTAAFAGYDRNQHDRCKDGYADPQAKSIDLYIVATDGKATDSFFYHVIQVEEAIFALLVLIFIAAGSGVACSKNDMKMLSFASKVR